MDSRIRTFVFGDIEDNEEAFNDVLECIRAQNIYTNCIFLGDIYAPKTPTRAVEHIRLLLWELNIELHPFINVHFNETESSLVYAFCDDVKRKFNELRARQRVDIYTLNNKFRTGTTPNKFGLIPNEEVKSMVAENFASSRRQMHVRFLLGNKEVDILKDLSNVSECNIIDGKFEAKFIYYRKHVKHESMLSFTLEELNILFNYLSICTHFFYHEGTLYQHIYANARTISHMEGAPPISRIISGHNRCFGYYKDNNIKADIYMLDMTHEEQSTIKNRMMLINKDVYYFSNRDIVRQLLCCRLSANKTFLRGGWDETVNVSTIEFYKNRIRQRTTMESVSTGHTLHENSSLHSGLCDWRHSVGPVTVNGLSRTMPNNNQSNNKEKK